MTYVLEDRPDGQVDILLLRPSLIGTFPDREMAGKVLRLLEADQTRQEQVAPRQECPPPQPEGVALTVPPVRALVPVAAPRPMPVVVRPSPPKLNLTEAQLDRAFARIAEGEKLSAVAADLAVPFGQLRGVWARHCRMIQKHIADGGQQPCSLCQTPFVPSLTHPDTCARCSRDQ